MSFRGQFGRLRSLAEAVLAAYQVHPARLVPLAPRKNAPFRVAIPGRYRYMLRIDRATGSPFNPPRSAADGGSETIRLSALRRVTGLAVPDPVPTADGAPLTVADAEAMPAPKVCVLLRWGQGRFLDAV